MSKNNNSEHDGTQPCCTTPRAAAAEWFGIHIADVTPQQESLVDRLRWGDMRYLHPRIVDFVKTLQPDLFTKSFFIEYNDEHGRTTRRRITPLTFWLNARWIFGVYAWCHERDAFRTFFLERMRHIDPIDRLREFTPYDLITSLVDNPVSLTGRQIQRMVDGTLLAELCVRGRLDLRVQEYHDVSSEPAPYLK